MRRLTVLLVLGNSLIGITGCVGHREVVFRMHVIDADSRFEGAGVLDVNRDGKLDIQCGPSWYEGPSWKKHFVRTIEEKGGYYLGFCHLPVDVGGDGGPDVGNGARHNKRLSGVRNTGKSGGGFEEITIDEPGNIETAILADINNDGQPDILPNVCHGEQGWYEFHRDRSAAHGVRWERHPLPSELTGAGVGVGDINGDKRCDIVGFKGWAEQPPGSGDPWIWHGEFDLVDPGIPIAVDDVDGDGDADLIWGIGHNYGVYWMEQGKSDSGERTWIKHEIDRAWSQAHVILLGDLDGDGRKEFVTGKRYWAHNGSDPGESEQRCLYWYKFDRKTRQWQRHTIHEGGPAGVGTSAQLEDIDRDGDLDIVCPGKSGLYLFENLRRP